MAPRRKVGAVSLDAIGAEVAVMTLIGEFHHRETRNLERALGDALSGEHKHLVVDMRGVALLSAPSLRTLVKGAVRAREQGMGFALVRPDPEIWHAFELTGLDTQLVHSGSLDSAVAALRQR